MERRSRPNAPGNGVNNGPRARQKPLRGEEFFPGAKPIEALALFASSARAATVPGRRPMALPRLVVALAAAALAVAAPLPPSPFPPCTTDQQTVKDRLLSPLLAATASRGSAAAKSAAALQSQLRPDGSWPDVNYKDKTRGTWAATTHLNRVEQMAVAVRSPLSPSVNSTALLASANLALEYWLHGHFTNPNW